MNTEAAAPAVAPVFLALIPQDGYWIGVANHACADPEYIHLPAHMLPAVTADYCDGAGGWRDEPRCARHTAEWLAADDLPF